MDMKTEMKQRLLSHYRFRIELHAHTNPASRCSELPPEQFVKNFKANGYDGVVLTNHFSKKNFFVYHDYKDKEDALAQYLADWYAVKAAADRVGLKAYLGAELRFSDIDENDYLLFGADEQTLSVAYDFMEKDPAAFVREGKDPRSLFVQAHPHRDNMTQIDPALLDGYEVFNMHPNHNGRIALAQRYAMEHGIALRTIGTDYHHPGHENLSAARFAELPEDSFALATLLKQNDFIGEVGDTILF